MKGERKLSLVKPPPAEGAGSTDDVTAGGAPAEGLELEATPEELREAEELRRSLDRGDEPTAEALLAAFRPAPLDGGDLEAILARALGDLDAPATRIEATGAEHLRATLEEHDALRAGRLLAGPGSKARREDGEAAIAVALRAAWAPSPIGAARNDALVSRAVLAATEAPATPNHGASDARSAARPANDRGAAEDPPAPISLRRFRMGARTIATMTAVVAMAAGVLLMVGRLGTQSAPAPAAAVAQAPAASASAAPGERAPRIAARSTQEMFDAATPFPRSGGESARVDRIATARAADLRANRFASWGVR